MQVELTSGSPIDGLNKPYGRTAMRYYRELFNSLSAKQCGVEIDWDRGYSLPECRQG